MLRSIKSRGALVFGLVLVLLAGLSGSSLGWWTDAHVILSRVATKAVAQTGIPRFFIDGVESIAQASVDPDLLKPHELPILRYREHPNHFFDREYLEGTELPESYAELLKLLTSKGLTVSDTGTLPWALTEWAQKLAMCFAEHRKWPTNRPIQQKCLYVAGILSHYAQDLVQPLHTTIHHDGRVARPEQAGRFTPPEKYDSKRPGAGMHGRVDALLVKLEIKPEKLAKELQAELKKDQTPEMGAAWALALAEYNKSHALVEKVYAIADKLPPTSNWDGKWQPEVKAFAEDRVRAGVLMSAKLYVFAWQASAKLKLPDWLKR